MEQVYSAFVYGGFWMWPIQIVGLILVVASIRYAIDSEPIRLRFIGALSIVLIVMMCLGTVSSIIVALGDYATAAEKNSVVAAGISAILNQCGLTLVDLMLASVIVAIGIYRGGRRQLKALKP